MLILHLSPIFAARGIEKPFSFLIKAGFTYHSAHILTSANPRIIRLDHLEKLCDILRCEPNDIIRFVPSAQQLIDEGHPLQKLKLNDSAASFKEIISNMSFQEIQDLLLTKTNLPPTEDAPISLPNPQ